MLQGLTLGCCFVLVCAVLCVARWMDWESKLAYYDRTYGELFNEWCVTLFPFTSPPQRALLAGALKSPCLLLLVIAKA